MKQLAPLLVLVAGCTFQPGTGFVTLSSAQLDAAFVPGEARDLGDDAVLTDMAYTVALERFALTLERVDLQELQGATGGESFDPAAPPEGYTLCHGGHCHAEDGSLVSYAEIEAELAGGQAFWVTIAELPIEATVDMLTGELLTLDRVLPSTELPMADLGRLTLGLSALSIEAEVTASGVEPIGLLAELDLDEAFTADLDLPIDRDQSPTLSLAFTLEPGGDLFDELDFAALAVDGEVALDDPATATLLAHLLETPVTVTTSTDTP